MTRTSLPKRGQIGDPNALGLPRVRMCISWKFVLLGLAGSYMVGLLFLLVRLTEHEESVFNDPLKLIQDVQRNVDYLENELVLLAGWHVEDQEDNKQGNQGPLEIQTAPDSIRTAILERNLQARHLNRTLRLCRKLETISETELMDPSSGSQPQYHAYNPLAFCPTHKRLYEYSDKHLYFLYNPLHHERRVCGKVVPAYGILRIDQHQLGGEISQSCLETTRRFHDVIPDLTTTITKLPPITVLDNIPHAIDERKVPHYVSRSQECDVPCEYAGEFRLITQRWIKDTPFDFLFSMEGPAYYENLIVNPDAWQGDSFYATTAFHSDIPLPYFSFAEYNLLENPPVKFDDAIQGALFLARNCFSKNEREKLVQDLMDSGFRIDSLSHCLHNADAPKGYSLQDKQALMRQYLFYLAFENQNYPDYITEKLWAAFVAGTIPVYLGAPNIKEHVPDHSVIAANDFPDAQALAEHLEKVASDRQLYEAYHAWRYKELPDHFVSKYNITKSHNVCRTCRWAYAKKYGLGWSHERQQVVDLQLPRHACLDSNGMLTWPVRERWFQSNDENEDYQRAKTAATRSKEPNLCPVSGRIPRRDDRIVAGSWQRTLHEHDGVIDLHVQSLHSNPSKRPVVLELVLPFDESATFRRVGPGHLEWQNHTSRLTILVQPSQQTPDRHFGRVVQLMHPRSVRIIVEDVDRFHVGAAKAENYFGRLLKQDWNTPFEVFVVDAPA